PDWLPRFVGRGDGTVLDQPGHLVRTPPQLWFAALPLLTLEALAWGLLGSAVTRRVLSGAALAALVAVPFWVLGAFAQPPVFLTLRLIAAGGALVASVVVFLTQSRDTPLGPPPRPEERPYRVVPILDGWDGDLFNLERRAPRLARAVP